MNIEAEAELERLGNARESEIKFLREQADLDIKRAKEMATIEVASSLFEIVINIIVIIPLFYILFILVCRWTSSSKW